MPAVITTSTTDPKKGEISKAYVDRMLHDYTDHITLGYDDGSREIYKHFYFELDLERIHDMIKLTKGADNKVFRVHLSLNLPDQRSCDDKFAIGNYLSILLCCTDKKGGPQYPRLDPDDYILAEGFADFEKPLAGTCCVQGTPPPPQP